MNNTLRETLGTFYQTNFFSNDDEMNKTRTKSTLYLTGNKKNDYMKNFMYVNSNYRKQLNCAFLKYNPGSHLEDLKILIQSDPSIRKDVVKVKEEVEDDIKWTTDKHHFLKKYLVLRKKNQRSKSVQEITRKKKDNNNLNNINNKNNQNEECKAINTNNKSPSNNIYNNIISKQKEAEINLLKKNLGQNVLNNNNSSTSNNQINKLPPITGFQRGTSIKFNIKKDNINPLLKTSIQLGYKDKSLSKKEKKNLQERREQSIEEFDQMIKATKAMDELLDCENIKEKIDMYKTDYDRHVFLMNQNEENNNNLHMINEIDENVIHMPFKDYYEEDYKDVVDKMGTLYCFKLQKALDENEKILSNKIESENKNFNSKIVFNKKNTMTEFKNYIDKNKICIKELVDNEKEKEKE